MRHLRSLAAAPLAAALALACDATPPALEEQPADGPTVATTPADEPDATAADEVERAQAALAAGDVAGAHELLTGVLVDGALASARMHLEDGVPEDALLFTDRALELDPRHREARLLSARGRLALAEKAIDAGRSAVFVEGGLRDALDAYRAAGDSPEALFGAARAAWLLRENGDALRFARAGMDALGADGRAAEALSIVPERVLSEAAFGAYVEARTAAAEGSSEATSELFAEAEDALSRLLGRDGTDPWVWSTLADLYEWEGMLADSRATIDRGLGRAPDDSGLLERLVRVARKQGGREQVVAALDAVLERRRDLPLAHWYASVERFELTLARLLDGTPDVEGFRAAEAGFARCRELEPSYEQSCIGYEVVCRSGAGWSHFNTDALDEAVLAFLSMDELAPRGLEWKIEGRLLSGVDGLAFVAGKHNEREDWAGAAELFETLRAYQPEQANWANNAGFFHRDAAVELEFVGRRLCRAARGEIDDAETLARLREAVGIDAAAAGSADERAAFAAAADATMERARATMRRSSDAYRDAARLAPDDVRIVNDTALVLVYYLHEDLEYAEAQLLRSVELGSEQLEGLELDEDARWELQNAWGDAHQNLGVLAANHRDDKAAALAWFERAVEIGPEPRPVVSARWIPHLKGELDASAHDELLATTAWALPCTLDENR